MKCYFLTFLDGQFTLETVQAKFGTGDIKYQSDREAGVLCALVNNTGGFEKISGQTMRAINSDSISSGFDQGSYFFAEATAGP